MLGPMAGKAPLLLASVLFTVGAVGLALTSAERAEWGPFEPHVQVPAEQHAVILVADVPFVDPTPLESLLATPIEGPVIEQAEAPALVLAEVEPEPEVEAAGTPALVPLRVFGLSSDTGGVAAAPATPPLRAVNVAADDAEPGAGEPPGPGPSETPEPSDGATPEPSESETLEPPEPSASATPEPSDTETPEPEAEATPEQ